MAMDKIINKNNMKYYIIAGSILLVCIILVVVFSLVPKKEKGEETTIEEGTIQFSRKIVKSSRVKTVTNSNLSKEQCVGKICISKLEINAYPNKGYITYIIKNKNKKKETGGLKIIFNDGFTLYTTYDLDAGESTDGYMNYSSHDLNSIESYKLEKMTDRDYSVFIN
jgi:hypothetical protein